MKKRTTRLAIYLTCVNRAIIGLTASAQYLDVNAPEDIVYNLILTILGFLGFIYLLGMLPASSCREIQLLLITSRISVSDVSTIDK